MPKQAKRGFLPTDERDFGKKNLPKLRRAAEEVYYLLNRGYPVTSTTRFIGDHYLLSERQRLLLMKCRYQPWREGNKISAQKRIGYLPYQLAAIPISKEKLNKKLHGSDSIYPLG